MLQILDINIRETLSCAGDTKKLNWGAGVGQSEVGGPRFYKYKYVIYPSSLRKLSEFKITGVY